MCVDYTRQLWIDGLIYTRHVYLWDIFCSLKMGEWKYSKTCWCFHHPATSHMFSYEKGLKYLQPSFKGYCKTRESTHLFSYILSNHFSLVLMFSSINSRFPCYRKLKNTWQNRPSGVSTWSTSGEVIRG